MGVGVGVGPGVGVGVGVGVALGVGEGVGVGVGAGVGEEVAEDDGVGFNLNQDTGGEDKGLGLIGMRERAALVGGTLQIESKANEGTTIFARVPVQFMEEEAGGAK